MHLLVVGDVPLFCHGTGKVFIQSSGDVLCQTVNSLHTNIDSSSWINSSSVFHLSLDCPDYI